MKQDSYHHKLTEKIKLLRSVSNRFGELAQLCSYQEIARSSLRLQEHTRISEAAYGQIVQSVEQMQQKSTSQFQLIIENNDRVIGSTKAIQLA